MGSSHAQVVFVPEFKLHAYLSKPTNPQLIRAKLFTEEVWMKIVPFPSFVLFFSFFLPLVLDTGNLDRKNSCPGGCRFFGMFWFEEVGDRGSSLEMLDPHFFPTYSFHLEIQRESCRFARNPIKLGHFLVLTLPRTVRNSN